MGEDDTALRERVTRVEDQITELRSLITGVKTEAKVSARFYDKQDHETRLQNLERDVANNKLVSSAVRWLAMSIGGSGIVVALTALMEAVV